MRALDQDEKTFLKAMVQSNQQLGPTNFASLIDSLLKDKEIYLNYENNLVEIRFDKSQFASDTDLVDIVRLTAWQIMKFSNLLDYLADLNYIYLYQEAPLENEFTYGQLIQGKTLFGITIQDPNVKRNLIFMSYRTIAIGQSLLDYVTADFHTEDEIRHNENIKIGEQSLDIGRKSIVKATNAIRISIALGVISIAVSIFLSLGEKIQKIEIDETQLERLLDNHNSSTQKIIEEIQLQKIEIPDTTLTKIVEPIELKEKVKHTTKPKLH